MANTVMKLFGGARWTNLARHAAKGTLAKHLARKALIKWLCRTFVRF